MIGRYWIAIVLLSSIDTFGWSGKDAEGEKPVFFGRLTSFEGNTFNVTNISIGRSRGGDRTVTLYEMPKQKTAGKDKVLIDGNPYHDLTTTELDLLKVKKIEVPSPQTKWIWEKPKEEKRSPTVSYEFIELVVTWKDNQKISYLLELGTEDTTKPLKLFSDSTGQKPIGTSKDSQRAVFCTGIKATDLRKKGAPFPSIKELVIDGSCYQPPQNGAGETMKRVVPPQKM